MDEVQVTDAEVVSDTPTVEETQNVESTPADTTTDTAVETPVEATVETPVETPVVDPAVETDEAKNVRTQTCASEVDAVLVKYNCKIEVVNNVNVVSN